MNTQESIQLLRGMFDEVCSCIFAIDDMYFESLDVKGRVLRWHNSSEHASSHLVALPELYFVVMSNYALLR